MLNKLKEVKKEMCNCTLRWPRFLCATEPNESLNIGKDFNSDRIALVHQHALRSLFWKRKCPVAVACVGSVPLRAERNIGPREEVFCIWAARKMGRKQLMLSLIDSCQNKWRPRVHSGQTTGHARDLSTSGGVSGHFPVSSHKFFPGQPRPLEPSRY